MGIAALLITEWDRLRSSGWLAGTEWLAGEVEVLAVVVPWLRTASWFGRPAGG